MIEWSQRYSVSDTLIDTQHQQLFIILNDILEGMKTGKCEDKNFVQTILNKLLDYTQYHFREEENRFNTTDYPMKTEHIRAHKEFIDQVKKKIVENHKGLPCLNTTEIANFTYNWLSKHILTVDKTYIEYICRNI